MKTSFLFSCEHASNQIPAKYTALFKEHQSLLKSHRGWDIGANVFYTALCRKVLASKQKAQWSRLLIELNRSLHHKNLFSEVTQLLPKNEKQFIIEEYYLPYRSRIEEHIENLLKQNNHVIHLSVHSFTPLLNGQTRNADIAFLYDPKRKKERDFCYALKQSIRTSLPQYLIRMNYPYKGFSDGLTTALRAKYNQAQYLGIELELNQKHFHPKNANDKFVQPLTNVIATFLNSVN